MKSETFVIEKGLPVAPHGRGPGRPRGESKYPFSKMSVGDSFEFDKKRVARIAGAASVYAKNYGGKFSVRSNGTTARIWRVA